MKKTGLLNRHISTVVASMGHTDMLVVADAGLPVPPGVRCIDLAVRPGLPGLLEVVEAIAGELEVERLIIAEELEQRGTALPQELQACFPQAQVDRITHEELKALTTRACAIIRTGECTPYANVVLCSGVIF